MNLQQLKYKFLTAGIVEQLIYANVAVFILVFIFEIFKIYIPYTLLQLPGNFNDFIVKPWTIVTYGFLHQRFIHLLSNLLMLFYFGNLFINYFTKKQLLNFYILGTIVGGIFFLLGVNYIPSLSPVSTLMGASAGVTAILIGVATYMPNYQMKFALIGYVKLWYIALFWLGYNLILITAGQNLGGNLAHLGGALFGFLYVQQTSNKELEIVVWFKGLFERKEKPLKTVYKSRKPKQKPIDKTKNQQKIDGILDKIGKSGYDTLSKEEKDFLFRQGKK